MFDITPFVFGIGVGVVTGAMVYGLMARYFPDRVKATPEELDYMRHMVSRIDRERAEAQVRAGRLDLDNVRLRTILDDLMEERKLDGTDV